MKNILSLLFAATILSSCGSSFDLSGFPDCIKAEIENIEREVVKVGVSEDNYWLIYEDSYFGSIMDDQCEQASCYGWCGLTSEREVQNVFDEEWELVWER